MLIRSLHTVTRFNQIVEANTGAFLGSLITGMALHYKKIVKNEYYGYPQEWFPSVSATIGLLLRGVQVNCRRLVSRTKCIPDPHRHLFRSSIRVDFPLVLVDCPTRDSIAKSHCCHWRVTDVFVWRMGLCDFY